MYTAVVCRAGISCESHHDVGGEPASVELGKDSKPSRLSQQKGIRHLLTRSISRRRAISRPKSCEVVKQSSRSLPGPPQAPSPRRRRAVRRGAWPPAGWGGATPLQSGMVLWGFHPTSRPQRIPTPPQGNQSVSLRKVSGPFSARFVYFPGGGKPTKLTLTLDFLIWYTGSNPKLLGGHDGPLGPSKDRGV